MTMNRKTLVLIALYGISIAAAAANIMFQGTPLIIRCTLWAMAAIGVTAWFLSVRPTLPSFGALAAVLVFIFLCVASGVNTGFPFGDYAFTNLAGTKIWDVPVVLPFSWLAILIPAWVASDRILRYQHVVVASLIVVAFDSVLEFAADTMDLWHWSGGFPGELNFLSWFGVSYLAFTILKKYATVRESNAVVPHFLFAQLLYFFLTDVGMRFIFPHA